MSDQLLLNNYLLVLKSTVEVYVHGTLESSNIDIRGLLKNGLDETMKAQADTFDLMVKNGWYEVENVNSKIINKTIDKINNN